MQRYVYINTKIYKNYKIVYKSLLHYTNYKNLVLQQTEWTSFFHYHFKFVALFSLNSHYLEKYTKLIVKVVNIL